MRIALGADHAGVELKAHVRQLLAEMRVPYEDFGTLTNGSVDYPDFAAEVAGSVASGRFDRGILVCGSGIGMAIAANKIRGVRAAAVNDVESARLAREHNDANVLALGGRMTSIDRAREIVRVFLETPFAGGRHQRRIDKITEIELNGGTPPSGEPARNSPASKKHP
jgi:ribose 5-phosphate isomerase B